MCSVERVSSLKRSTHQALKNGAPTKHSKTEHPPSTQKRSTKHSKAEHPPSTQKRSTHQAPKNRAPTKHSKQEHSPRSQKRSTHQDFKNGVPTKHSKTEHSPSTQKRSTHQAYVEGPDGVLVQGGVGSELDNDVSVLNRRVQLSGPVQVDLRLRKTHTHRKTEWLVILHENVSVYNRKHGHHIALLYRHCDPRLEL